MMAAPSLPSLEDHPARIEVRLLSLPTRRSLGTAHDAAPAEHRQLVVVGVETTDGVLGWGECSALNAPTYTHEWAADSFDRLANWADGGPPPDASAFPMAAAAVEMATVDAALRTQGRSLADHLGTTGAAVTAGATIGLGDVVTSVAEAGRLIDHGYRKIKIKVDPNQIEQVPHELRHHYPVDGDPTIELHVDGNGSLGQEHLMTLLGLTWHGVSTIEQPFPVGRPDLAAELMLGTDAVIVADEGAATKADVVDLVDRSALDAVAIKPPRLGGIGPAIELLSWCRQRSIAASIGGMLESGLGRHSLAAIAPLDGFSVTGDLSPARQWLREDPWPDVEMIDGSVRVPSGPGVAPLPNVELLDRLTVRRSGQQR